MLALKVGCICHYQKFLFCKILISI